MTDEDIKKFRGVVREEIGTALKPVNTKLGRVDKRLGNVEKKVGKVEKKLDILWDQVEKVTFGLDNVKETLDTHTSIFKRIEAKLENHSDDIHKLNRRVVVLEDKNGIVSPPESNII
jgi:peptidoglycan hydrolase CwlO-like protein